MSFSADFELVPANAAKNEGPSRFLFGHPPSWEDLAGNLDVPREFTPGVIEDLENRFGKDERVLILSDDIGVGKTTLLRRVAFEFTQKSIGVLICSALSRLDSARTADAIDAIDQPILIIVDNFADQATVITELMASIEKKAVVVFGAERRYRQPYVMKALSKISGRLVQGLELRFIEAERLLRSYLKLGMVGRAEAAKNPNHFSRQIFRDPIAVAVCRILNDFRPLDRIIKSINEDTSSEDRRRYLMAALAQLCFRGGVRHEVLAAAGGYRDWQDQFETRHPMPLAYFDRERSFVVPLNSTLATRVIELAATTEPELIFDCFVSLAKAIAPRVNRAAIRRRSPEARLAGRLFDYDPVVREFLGPLASAFYSDTRESWQWNSRYWEQVALMHLADYQAKPNTSEGQDALAQAVQHARHAVAVEFHPLSLTTLGRVLMAELPEEGISRTATYDEAFEALSQAIKLERSWSPPSVHPFIVLFRGTRTLLTLGRYPSQGQIESLREFSAEARRLFPRDTEMMVAITDIATEI